MNDIISIIIPTKNRPFYLDRALRSVQAQGFVNKEVIVVNDASEKDYSGVVCKYSDTIDQYVCMESSLGVSAARNRGIDAALGKWLLFLDDDDELKDGYLQVVESQLKEIKEVGLGVFFWCAVEELNYLDCSTCSKANIVGHPENRSIAAAASRIGLSYGVVVKNNFIKSEPIFNESFRFGEDTEFIIKLLSRGFKPIFIPVVGVTKHNHIGERLSSDYMIYHYEKTYQKIINLHYDYLCANPDVLEEILLWMNKLKAKCDNIIS